MIKYCVDCLDYQEGGFCKKKNKIVGALNDACVKEESEDSEETAARLREVEMFQANHPELPALPNEVIELWEKSGISLEKAFERFQNKNKVEELEKKIAALEKENMKKEQKVYAKETSPGSANSAAGKPAVDPFVEGLFAKY